MLKLMIKDNGNYQKYPDFNGICNSSHPQQYMN